MGVIEQNMYKFMTQLGWSQSELARRSGVKKSSINRYINGDDMPISKALAIANALGVSIDELLGTTLELSSIERELVECYRCMTPRFKNLLLENARAYAENGQAKNNQVEAV